MTIPEPSELLVRGVAIYGPISLVLALWISRRPDRPQVASVVVATAWNVAMLLPLNVIATELGWWRFGVTDVAVSGVPIDLWLGWALMWGGLPMLAGIPLAASAAILVVVDLLVMPLLSPVVELSDTWLLGEVACVLVALVPGMTLGRWTARRMWALRRAALQAVAFGIILLYVFPSIALGVEGASWAPLWERPRWQVMLAVIGLMPFLAISFHALVAFARAGGTPLPLDPPRRLVVSGPYAFLANPMQVAGTVILVAWGVLLDSPMVILAGLTAGILAGGLIGWWEDRELAGRFGTDWRAYRSRVRLWLPRWRPLVEHPAQIFVLETCRSCSQVGRWLERRNPIDLSVAPASSHPNRLSRITYEGQGEQASGVAAVARALEHTNLGWASLAWVGLMPVVNPLLQLVTDASGGGPLPPGRGDGLEGSAPV